MADRTTSSCLGIIAGGGTMPVAVATAARAAGRPVHVIAIEGAAADVIEPYPHTWVNFGQIGLLLKVLKRQNCQDVVIIGGVRRPKLADLRIDMGGIANAPSILRKLVGGDNSVLSGIVEFFEDKGFHVMGAHEIAPELVAQSGALGRRKPSKQDMVDINMAAELIEAMGKFDVGQAVVVARGHVLAVEAAEGTDALLERCQTVKKWSLRGGKSQSGVLIKCAKPGQERRVDLPAIGPDTVRLARAANLRGIAIAAGDVLIAEREETIAEANRLGVFIYGIDPKAGGR